MFIEYKVYDEITDTLSRGIGTFAGIDYDQEWEFAKINFIGSNNIICQLNPTEYSALFESIRSSLIYEDKIFKLNPVWVISGDSPAQIASCLTDAQRCNTIFQSKN